MNASKPKNKQWTSKQIRKNGKAMPQMNQETYKQMNKPTMGQIIK